MAAKRKPPTPPLETGFDLWFRRVIRVCGLVILCGLAFRYLVQAREVNPAWLFLTGGMLALDGLAGQIGSGRK